MNIITNNCLGGYIYKDILKEEYKNPFIWTLFKPNDFIDFIENYDSINFKNYKIIRENNNKPNNYQLIIDNKYHIRCIHHYYDAKTTKPVIKGNNVYYNHISDYIIEKYLKRLDRMKKEKNTIFIYYEPNLKCDKLSFLPELAKKHKCLAFTNDLVTTKYLKVYSINKNWNGPSPLIKRYKKEILDFINKNK